VIRMLMLIIHLSIYVCMYLVCIIYTDAFAHFRWPNCSLCPYLL